MIDEEKMINSAKLLKYRRSFELVLTQNKSCYSAKILYNIEKKL